MSFFTDRIKLYAASAFALLTGLAAVFLLFGNWTLEKDVERLGGEVRTAQADLATCRAERGQFEQDVKAQSDAVAEWKAEADRVRARGQAAVNAARAKSRALELELLRSRPLPRLEGETPCQAADRMLLEELG